MNPGRPHVWKDKDGTVHLGGRFHPGDDIEVMEPGFSTGFKVWFAVCTIFTLACIAGIVFVAVHFLDKVW